MPYPARRKIVQANYARAGDAVGMLASLARARSGAIGITRRELGLNPIMPIELDEDGIRDLSLAGAALKRRRTRLPVGRLQERENVVEARHASPSGLQ